MRQRIFGQLVQRITESRLTFEFCECLVRGDQFHVRDVGALANESRQPGGLALGDIAL